MIFNCTKKTKERFHIDYFEEEKSEIDSSIKEMIVEQTNDELFNWGLKYFSFDGRKCLQLLNFKTKFNLYIFDLKVSDLNKIPDLITFYLFELYKDDKEVIYLLNKYVGEYPFSIFTKITNKSVISSLNLNEDYFMMGTERFWNYFKGNTLNTIEINRDANWHNFVTINKSKHYIQPAKSFKEALIERYK